jgi:hypothetical protein
MIVHTLLYSFPAEVPEADRAAFFAALRELVESTGLVEAFDVKPHLWLTADERARGMTAASIAQFTTKDLATLDEFSKLPVVFDFVTDWKGKLHFEAAYANHEPLAV